MKDDLAKRLLTKVMGWDEVELAKENLNLQIFSEYKYDTYQQFFPGMKFIESLSLWLNQFDDVEKVIAYKFIRNKIIFFSWNELNHIIKMAFHDSIKPHIIQQISNELKLKDYKIKQILGTKAYKILKRQSLFLGLSDGARIDFFRRTSELSHEQVYSTYMIAEIKSVDLLEKLSTELNELGSKINEPKFRIIFLIDDFTASGISYLRKEGTEFGGKIDKFLKEIKNDSSEISKLIDTSDLKIYIVFYLATKKAITQIKKMVQQKLKAERFSVEVIIVHEINDSTMLNKQNLDSFLDIIKKYYDRGIESDSYKKGKCDNPYLGFDECGLPLILSHNTPNNSLPILWFNSDDHKFRGLFPRVQRFKGSES